MAIPEPPPPEAPVHDLLDRLGIPFRTAVGALVAAHGTRPLGWTDAHLDCLLPGAALCPGAGPARFPWHAGHDPTLPPRLLKIPVRAARLRPADLLLDRRAERNLAAALAVLTPALGRGEALGTSNTVGRAWSCGMARVQAVAFPPRLNRRYGPNARHRVDPGAKVECLVVLYPGWLPALTAAQRGWLADFVRLGLPEPPRTGAFPDRWHRWPGPGAAPAPGYGPSRDGRGLAVVAGDFVCAIPREQLRAVVLDVAAPARFGGWEALSVTHAPLGHDVHPPHGLSLVYASYAGGALAPSAQALAAAFALPVERRDALDD